MLSAAHRLRSSADFTEVVRHGRRTSRATLTVHLLPGDLSGDLPVGTPAPTDAPARAGLVVSKAVGGSVERHRVARRLRHLLRPRLATLPAGSRLVVRAAPRAQEATSENLARDLDSALGALLRR